LNASKTPTHHFPQGSQTEAGLGLDF